MKEKKKINLSFLNELDRDNILDLLYNGKGISKEEKSRSYWMDTNRELQKLIEP